MCCASATTSANAKGLIWLARLANRSTSWLDLMMIVRFGFQRLHLDQFGANCIAGRIPKACLQRLGGNIVAGRLPQGSNLVCIYIYIYIYIYGPPSPAPPSPPGKGEGPPPLWLVALWSPCGFLVVSLWFPWGPPVFLLRRQELKGKHCYMNKIIHN